MTTTKIYHSPEELDEDIHTRMKNMSDQELREIITFTRIKYKHYQRHYKWVVSEMKSRHCLKDKKAVKKLERLRKYIGQDENV